jgi:Helix-turn-helix domain
MPGAVNLREDFSAAERRALAKRSRDAHQSRRLLSLAAIRDGKERGEAAKIAAMDRRTLRDWVHRFNAAGPDGLLAQRSALRRLSKPRAISSAYAKVASKDGQRQRIQGLLLRYGRLSAVAFSLKARRPNYS